MTANFTLGFDHVNADNHSVNWFYPCMSMFALPFKKWVAQLTNGTEVRLVPGSWVGARRLVPPFLIPHCAPHGFTQDPSTDYSAAPQTTITIEAALLATAGSALAALFVALARPRSKP